MIDIRDEKGGEIVNEFKGIVNDKLETVIKEFQGIISFGYVILIILGMMFESIYYGQFGINVFHYSGILDFLLVPFRRPTVLIILVGLSLFWYFYFIKLYNFLGNKSPKIQKMFFPQAVKEDGYIKSQMKWLIIFFVVTTVAWAFVTSKKEKENLYKQKADIEINFDSNSNNSVIKGKMIGKNDLNIFLLDNNNRVQIIPLSSGIIRINPVME